MEKEIEPKIERGIPIEDYRPRGAGWKAKIFRKMKVGDSVLIPGLKSPSQLGHAASRIFGTGCYAMRTTEGGVRVWRTK